MVNTLTVVKQTKKIKASCLKKLGYRLPGEQIPLGDKPYKYGILKVMNEDNSREVGFCFLFSSRSMQGIILPHPYDFYRIHPIKNLERFLEEQAIH